VNALVRHLAQCHVGQRGIVPTEAVRQFWAPYPGQRFTLGWDTPSEPS